MTSKTAGFLVKLSCSISSLIDSVHKAVAAFIIDGEGALNSFLVSSHIQSPEARASFIWNVDVWRTGVARIKGRSGRGATRMSLHVKNVAGSAL